LYVSDLKNLTMNHSYPSEVADQAYDYGNEPSGVGNAVFWRLKDAGAPPLWDAMVSVAGEGVGGGMVTRADTGTREQGEGLRPMAFVWKSD